MAGSWTNEVLTVEGGTDYWDGAVEKLSVTYPNDDLVEHDPLSLNCVCVPLKRIIIGCHWEEGCLCVMTEVVHHSLDGRELSE